MSEGMPTVRADVVARLILDVEGSSVPAIMEHMIPQDEVGVWLEMDPARPDTPRREPTFDVVQAEDGPTLGHCEHRMGSTVIYGSSWHPDGDLDQPPRVVVEDCVLPDTLCDLAVGLSLRDVAILPVAYEPLGDAHVTFIGSEAGVDVHTSNLVIHLDPDFRDLPTR